MIDLSENLEAGRYTNKLAYPKKGDTAIHKEAYRRADIACTKAFSDDCAAYLRECGAPEKAIPKLSAFCWKHGHAYGHSEVIAYLLDLGECFE